MQRIRRLLAALTVSAVALGAALPAHAQYRSQIGTLLFGYATSVDDNGLSGSVGGSLAGYKLKNGVAGGGFEIGYHFLGSRDEGINSARQGLFQTTLNFRAQAVEGKIQPYFVGGAGIYWVYTSLGDPKYVSDTAGKFGFNLGGGLAIPLKGKGTQLLVDARWHEAIDGNINGTELDAVTIYGGLAVSK